MSDSNEEVRALIEASRKIIDQMNGLLAKAGSELRFCPDPVESADKCPDQPPAKSGRK